MIRHLIACALLSFPVALPAQQPSGGPPRAPLITQAELVQRLSGTMDSLAKRGAFSGVVLVAKNGAPVWERAYGMAVHARKLPNTVETAFNLGSINKLFTQVAIRQLTLAGKVNPDSTISVYWPDYPNQAIAKSVTIRQLLGHRAGLGGHIFGTLPGRPRSSIRHNRDYLALFVNEAPAFAPGTRQQYCNAC